MESYITNFQGNCIYKDKLNYILDKKQKIYLSNSRYEVDEDKELYIIDDKRILNQPIFSDLNNLFSLKVKQYVKKILEIDHDIQLLSSWVTINKNTSFHHSHHHPNSFISVCFYPQLKSGNIMFETQYSALEKHTNLLFNRLNNNVFNSRQIVIELEELDFVIFPSWLTHGTTPNTHQTNRIMIGANYYIKGDLGSYYRVNDLKL